MAYTPAIPRADAAFLRWAQSFVEGIAADPGAVGLGKPDVDSLQHVLDEFAEKFRIASCEATRTRCTITDKNDARRTLENLARGYYRDLLANEGIPDMNLIALGVRPRNIARNKRTCPKIAPWLAFIGSTPGVDHLSVSDASPDGTSAKPHGAVRLELFRAVQHPGDPQPTIEEARYHGSHRKANLRIPTDDVPDESRCTYWGR